MDKWLLSPEGASVDERPSFRRRRDVLRLVAGLLAPWLLFGLALAPALALRTAHRAGSGAEWAGPPVTVWFYLLAFPAMLTAPALWLVGLVRLFLYRNYRRSVYGWVWLPVNHANAIALLLATGH